MCEIQEMHTVAVEHLEACNYAFAASLEKLESLEYRAKMAREDAESQARIVDACRLSMTRACGSIGMLHQMVDAYGRKNTVTL